MKAQQNFSERLIRGVLEKVKKTGISIKALSEEVGINYQTLYFAINHQKRSRKPKRATVSYQTGKSLELWLQK